MLVALIIGLVAFQLIYTHRALSSREEIPGFIPPQSPTNRVPENQDNPPEPGPGSGDLSMDQNKTGRFMTLQDIPDSEFKKQVENLPADIQKEVLEKIRKNQQLLKDIESIRVDSNGMIYYVCKIEFDRHAESAGAEAGENESFIEYPEFSGPVPNAEPPAFHSRPGCSKMLFLDFNGHDISDTAWNSEEAVAAWNCKPYDTDGDPTRFSVAEQEIIYEVWLRVSEDYAPFDVDVTTEQPAAWTSTTGHALITPTTDANGVPCPHDGYGGVAYLDVFNDSRYSYNFPQDCYSPAWVIAYPSAADVAEVISHELGHNMGLLHDGETWDSDEYYNGHQNGLMSWAAIMGTAYDHDVTQWSKGDYYAATNPEDDLQKIADKLSDRPDDHGDYFWNATVLTLDADGAASVSGMTETTDDPDLFVLNAPSAMAVYAEVRVAQLAAETWGANLDVLLEIIDSSGSVVASNNEEMVLSAQVYAQVPSGSCFLQVIPVGVGDPMSSTPTGYTSYGSLGRYELVVSAISLTDTDNDGLPNDWERLYFGNETAANPTNIAANGVNTLMQTYIAGISPIDQNALFETSLGGASGFIVSWDALSGRVYSVFGTTNLSQSFQPLETGIAWPQSSWTDEVERAGSFYQVDVELE